MQEPITKCLSLYPKEPIKWLWPGRLPRGKVTLLCGDPGLGKSFVTMDMAARVTACQDWPDSGTPLKAPGSVLVLSAEDDPSDTIRPRLEAAGGDPANLVVLEGVRRGQHGTAIDGVTLQDHIEAIEVCLSRMERPRLVIIDPISAYMGDTDTHNNAEVRAILAELSRIASKFGPAIVCVTHLNKSAGGKAVYRAMGSLAFTAAARIAWLVTKMPGDEDKRVMTLMKSNLPEVGKGMSFHIVQGEEGGHVQWLDTSLDITADFAESSDQPGAEAMDDATEFLKAAIASGPRPASELFREAHEAGIAVITLKRAKKLLGVEARRGGSPAAWMWGRKEKEGPKGIITGAG